MPVIGPDIAHAAWPGPATASGIIETFRDEILPQPATLAGYSAIIAAFGLDTERPARLSVIGTKHRVFERDGWKYYTPRHAPKPNLGGHLTFALRYEGVNLAILAGLFENVEPRAIERVITATPTGRYARRIWFLYEWLMGRELDILSSKMGTYVPVVDDDMQLAVLGQNSKRHRARNNLLGTPDFCPRVNATAVISEGQAARYLDRAASIWAGLGAEESRQLSGDVLAGEADASIRLTNAQDEPGARAQVISALQVLATPRSYAGQMSAIDHALAYPAADRMPASDQTAAHVAAVLQRTETVLDPVISAALAGFGFMCLMNGSGSNRPHASGSLSDHWPHLMLHLALANLPGHAHGVTVPILQAMTKNSARYRELAAKGNAIKPNKTNRTNAYGNKFPDLTPWAEVLFTALKQAVDIELPLALARVHTRASVKLNGKFEI